VQGIQGPTAISADAGNIATLGSDSLISVPQSSLWSARLRSFQALGNNTFEVDQRNVGNSVTVSNSLVVDRWQVAKVGTMAATANQAAIAVGALSLPGTNFGITRSYLHVNLTTAEPSLAAGDVLMVQQNVEGPRWRELQNDVHSMQVLVRSNVANLSFGVALRDPSTAHSLTNILTIPTANAWTVLTLPNLPVWPAGTFVNTPGNVGYILTICLAAGSTYASPANGTWQNGNFISAVGQSNFAASPVNSTFDLAYISHEPGALCSNPPMDCPFTQNLDDCLRYYQKTYDTATLPGTVTVNNLKSFITFAQASAFGPVSFVKPMAKVPTMALYNNSTGAANSVQDSLGVNHASANVLYPGTSGFGAISYTTAVTSNAYVYAHYTADTGW
jgi:hypothetical protein